MGQKIALVIGNDVYPPPFDMLDNAKRSADKVAKFLKNRLGFRVTTLYNRLAPEIEGALWEIAKDLEDDSQFFFYYAGRGLRAGNSPNLSLLCRDVNESLSDNAEDAPGVISSETLASVSRVGLGDMFFCFDVFCEGTSLGRDDSERQGGIAGLLDAVTRPNGSRGTVCGRRLALSSCEDGQSASDDGIFATSFVEETARRLNGDGELKLGQDLVDGIAKRLPQGQTPRLDGVPFILQLETDASSEDSKRISDKGKTFQAVSSPSLEEPRRFSQKKFRPVSPQSSQTPFAPTADADEASRANRREEARSPRPEWRAPEPESESQVRKLDQLLIEGWGCFNRATADEELEGRAAEDNMRKALSNAERVLKERPGDVSALRLRRLTIDRLRASASPKTPFYEETTVQIDGSDGFLPTVGEGVSGAFRLASVVVVSIIAIILTALGLSALYPPARVELSKHFTRHKVAGRSEVAVNVENSALRRGSSRSEDLEDADYGPWAESSTRPAGFRQELEINGKKFGFCWIPAGEFDMGSPESEEGHDSSETLHHVKLTHGYWLLETPTTQLFYESVTKKNPSSFKGADLPVETVSFDDALEFCAALTGLLPSGVIATLPTEAQWEFACRAGTKTAYWYGESADSSKMNCDRKLDQTSPVKKYGANLWGLYDTLGNVCEWTSDRYGDYPSGTATDPRGVDRGSLRAVRGGGWHDNFSACRVASRGGLSPGSRGRDVGFRVLLCCESESSRASSQAFHASNNPWSDSPTRRAGFFQELEIGGRTYGFRWIPAGEFDMGAPASEENREPDEILHHVKLTKGFWMMETEVPQALYREVTGTNPSNFKGDDLPVERLSWHDAMNFCAELTKRLPKGMKASLPTEAQWEYACRAGTTTPYSFGGVLNGDKANCHGNYPYGTSTAGRYVKQTTPPKTYAANSWGLYDMHGNVCEWCLDCYGDYPTGTVVDPKGPNTASERTLRGGGWCSYATGCRSASRTGLNPSVRNSLFGVRVLVSYEDDPNSLDLQEDIDWTLASAPEDVWVDSSWREAGFRQELEINGEKYGFCWIPAGEFDMGSSKTENNRGADEELHHVRLTRGYWLLETPVTQRLYRSVMKTNPSAFKGADLPVETVSYDEALEFCAALTKLLPSGAIATLPTEAQWEFACRAGTKTAYWFGDSADTSKMNYGGNVNQTSPVKKYDANPWGLYDMHGNVYEWCLDWSGDYPDGTAADPKGPADGSNRVCRGGSWLYSSQICRSAARYGQGASLRNNDLGFRVLLNCEKVRPRPRPQISQEPRGSWRESSTRNAGFRQELMVNGKVYWFRWIPAGEFDMGSPTSETGRGSDERLHRVRLTKGFWMLETETTQALYRDVMGMNPSRYKGDNLPVETVSWGEAVEFCEKLTKRLPNGLKASLPTEAQWEYACRARTTTPYSFGSVLNGDRANCDGNLPYGTSEKRTSVGMTAPARSYAPNPWGLYDMHGNVYEWTSDYYGGYPAGTVTDPKGPNIGSQRVVRGGFWDSEARLCRSAFRGPLASSGRGNGLGFRFLLVSE